MRRVRIDGEALVRLSVHPSFYVISVKSHADSRHRALLFDRYRLRCFCSLPLIYLLPLVLFCLVHWKEDSEEEGFNSELYRNVDIGATAWHYQVLFSVRIPFRLFEENPKSQTHQPKYLPSSLLLTTEKKKRTTLVGKETLNW